MSITDMTGSPVRRAVSRACCNSVRLFVLTVVGAPAEAIDMVLGIGDRRVGIGPGEADLHGRKQHAIDGNRAEIGTPDTGVPQPLASLEGFDVKAVVEGRHFVSPKCLVGGSGDHVSRLVNVKSFTRGRAFLPRRVRSVPR